ncbi:MAG: hypothetical protein K2Y07_06005 [Nitrosomonas sp.]|nr:hypothetical protein [Nitrosomonas sp.]
MSAEVCTNATVSTKTHKHHIEKNNGKTLVLEVKGVGDERNRTKRAAMAVWIRTVKDQGGFGQWCFDVVFEPARTRGVLLKQVSECKNGE